MKILLFGSIAAGKSTIAKEVIKTYPFFEYISIDDFRRRFGDGTMAKEIHARKKFLKAIIPWKDQIIEASGLGELGNQLAQTGSSWQEEILVLIIYLEKHLINLRIKNRDWNIPFPGDRTKLDLIIDNINKGIESGEICYLWNNKPKVSILKTTNIAIDNQLFIINIIDNFIKTNRNDTRKNN